MKNSSDNDRNRTRDLPACSAVPQPTALLRDPFYFKATKKFAKKKKEGRVGGRQKKKIPPNSNTMLFTSNSVC